jgi:hypothetical protein
MAIVHIIELRGRAVAVVAADRLIIPDALTGADRLRVQAKALYALEIAAGERPGPYSDDRAERYADTVTARTRRPRAQRAD